MQRGDVYFTSVGNNFCFSEHFLPSDFKLSTLFETGAVPSALPWAKVDEESLCRAKYLMHLSLAYEYPSASINLGINQFSCL